MVRKIKAMKRVLRKSKGFTLAELLVVVGILVALVGVLLPVLFGIAERARVARVGVDMLEILNASLKHVDDTGSTPDIYQFGISTANPNPCSEIAVSSLIQNIGINGWLGPYLDKELAMSPFGTPYWLCSKLKYYNNTTWIVDGHGGCAPSAIGAPFEAGLYAFVVSIDTSGLAPVARQRIARAIDRSIDGRDSRQTGRVRYPADPTGICVGFIAGR